MTWSPNSHRIGPGGRIRVGGWLLAVAVALATMPVTGLGQDMEPRAYSSSPVGTNFLVLAVGRASGSVVFDPSIPITDVEATLGNTAIGYGRTFSFFGRQALITGAIPYTWGEVNGSVAEQRRSITRSGLADVRVKLSVNLLNGEALSLKEFVKRKRRTVVGASLTVSAPTGQYDPARLINLGTNRWAFKPEVGISKPAGKWDLDAFAGVWLYTPNDAFYPGTQRRTQDPLFAVQGHASYTFRPRLWAAFNATWYSGGAGHINGGPAVARLNNSRLGGTVSLPLGNRQSLKFSYSDGVSGRLGSSFRTFTLGYQVSWFDRAR